MPKNVEIAFLPSCSSKLSPQKQKWDELREKGFANSLFWSLGGVEDPAVADLRRMESEHAAMASLT